MGHTGVGSAPETAPQECRSGAITRAGSPREERESSASTHREIRKDGEERKERYCPLEWADSLGLASSSRLRLAEEATRRVKSMEGGTGVICLPHDCDFTAGGTGRRSEGGVLSRCSEDFTNA